MTDKGSAYSTMAMLSDGALARKSLGIDVSNDADVLLLKKVTELSNELYDRISNLEAAVESSRAIPDYSLRSIHTRDSLIPAMEALRNTADLLETEVAEDFWPFPTYRDLLYSV